MKATEREFHLGDVLSITTSRLVSPTGVDAPYDILNFMTGDSLSTTQLPRAADECKPHLLKQFPQLKKVSVSDCNTKNWREWLDRQVAKYGEKFVVKALPRGTHKSKDPVSETLEKLGGKKKVIVVVTK